MPHVTVIGAGIIGTAIARTLQEAGIAVTLVDRAPPGEGCSGYNAGLIAPGSCVPLASAEVLRHIPAWLLDPDGPLRIRWRHFPFALPWLLKLASNGDTGSVKRSAMVLRVLYQNAFECFSRLLGPALEQTLIRRTGYLYVYESEDAFKDSQPMWQLRRDCGVKIEMLSGAEARVMEPSLSDNIARGVYLPDEGYCSNPLELTRILAREFVKDGGRILREEAEGFVIQAGGRLEAVLTNQGEIPTHAAVIAAGAWSHRLAIRLGDRIPLESVRGYSITLPRANVALRVPLMSGESKVAVTPMTSGLRVAGLAEIGGLRAPPVRRRWEQLRRLTQRLFPQVNASDATTWMGHRPCLPDSLPVIGRSLRNQSVYYAFGHGLAGLTAAPVTSEIIRDLITQQPSRFDLRPFAADRF